MKGQNMKLGTQKKPHENVKEYLQSKKTTNNGSNMGRKMETMRK